MLFLCFFIFLLCNFPGTFTLSKREILVASYPPVTDCSLDDPLNPLLFTGIEVDILRQALKNVNWTEGADYYFNCTTWDDIFSVIPDNTRPVLGAINGITISTDRLSEGLKFSQPTMTTGMSLFYKREPKQVFYMRSVETSFLIFIGCLAFFIAFILFIYEGRQIEIMNYIHLTMTIYFKVDDAFFFNIESRFVILGIKFAMVIVIMIYTAFTTSNLTADNNYGDVTDVSSLRGLKVATLDYYQNTVRLYGSVYEYFPDVWTTEDFLTQINLTNATYIAYDAPVVSYVATVQCNLYELLPNFVKYDFGVMMPSQVDPDDESLLNIGLNQAFWNKTQADWVSGYFNKTLTNACTSKAHLNKSAISFNDVSGLWFIWGGGLVLATLVACFQMIRNYCIRKRKGNVFIFTGIRASADRTVRGKLSSLYALYASVSVSNLVQDKHELQEIYSKVVDAMKLNEKTISRIVSAIKGDLNFRKLGTMKLQMPSSLVLIDTINEKKEALTGKMSSKCLHRFCQLFLSNKVVSSNKTSLNVSRVSKDPLSPVNKHNSFDQSLSIAIDSPKNKKRKLIKVAFSPESKIYIDRISPSGSPAHNNRGKSKESPREIDVRDILTQKRKINGPIGPAKSSKRSLAIELFGVPEERQDITVLKEINAEILRIYHIAESVIDSEMIELALAKIAQSSECRKHRFSENYGMGQEFDFLMNPSNDPSTLGISSFSPHDSQQKTADRSGKKTLRHVFMLIPDSQGPQRNIRHHSFIRKRVNAPLYP